MDGKNYGKNRIFCDLGDLERTYSVVNALASPVRLGILKLLVKKSMSISELAQALNVSISSISMHVSILKEAGMISVISKPGKHGSFKVCGVFVETVQLDLFSATQEQMSKSLSWDVPIGSYSNADIKPPCGMLGENGYFEQEDEPYVFYHPLHDQARLLWFSSGEVSYRISNRLFHTNKVTRLTLSFEICSEAPGYNNNWPSEIYVKINGKKIHTFDIVGDYGGIRGLMTPQWWSTSNTQYGELKTIIIDDEGLTVDGERVSSDGFDALGIGEGYYFTFALGVEALARNSGGMNLFGRGFGNYDQDIKVEIDYLLS